MADPNQPASARQSKPIPQDKHPEAKGTVWLDEDRADEIPDHGPGDTVGECAGTEEESCSEIVVIASQSLRFIASAGGLPVHEALVCDEHLNDKLEGITLDLSVGGAHTRSKEFEELQENRSLFGDSGGNSEDDAAAADEHEDEREEN